MGTLTDAQYSAINRERLEALGNLIDQIPVSGLTIPVGGHIEADPELGHLEFAEECKTVGDFENNHPDVNSLESRTISHLRTLIEQDTIDHLRAKNGDEITDLKATFETMYGKVEDFLHPKTLREVSRKIEELKKRISASVDKGEWQTGRLADPLGG